MSVREFPPVWLPEGALDRGYSVTFGRHENVCPRSAYLYAKYGGGAASHPLERGSALHRALEVATRAAVQQDEPMIPPEVVKAIVEEVLADPVYRCPLEEHDYIRESAWRWAREWSCVPQHVVAVETLMQLDVGHGLVLRAKIDFAELLEDGGALRIWDYKSARAMPSQEDVGRRRPDGSIAAKDYQLVAYACACVFGVPIRVETCGRCGGAGFVEGASCSACGGEGDVGGRGRVEIPEPFPVAGRAQRVDMAYVFPGIEGRDGLMAKREASLTVVELHEYMQSLRAQARHVAHRIESGDWPAVRGEHCAECPAAMECPIPAVLRDHAGTINTVEEAREAAEQLDAEKAIHRARSEELRRFVKRLPGQRLRFGRDQVLELVYSESERITDREGMIAAIERAVRYGEPFERAAFVKTVRSTSIKQRRLSESELADELLAEGSNEKEAA